MTEVALAGMERERDTQQKPSAAQVACIWARYRANRSKVGAGDAWRIERFLRWVNEPKTRWVWEQYAEYWKGENGVTQADRVGIEAFLRWVETSDEGTSE